MFRDRGIRIPSRYLAAGTGLLALAAVVGCSPTDQEGLAKEQAAAAAAFAARPTPTPNALETQVRVALNVGQVVDIWEGTYRFGSDLARRADNYVSTRYSCVQNRGPWTSEETRIPQCREGGQFTSLRSYEEVDNPLRVGGTARLPGSYIDANGKYQFNATRGVNGFAFWSEVGGTPGGNPDDEMWVAWIPQETGGSISRRDGSGRYIPVDELREITRRDIQQQATIVSVEREKTGRLIIKGQKQDGSVVDIGRARLYNAAGF
jgi:hypothetical protein